MVDVQNLGQDLHRRAKEIVQRVTWIVNEDLGRAEFVRDTPPPVGAAAYVNDQIKRLAGANSATGAWLGDWQSFTASYFEELDRQAPMLATDLSNIHDAVARAFAFTNGARRYVAEAGGGILAESVRVPVYAYERAEGFVKAAAEYLRESSPWLKAGVVAVFAYLAWDIFRPRR